MKLWNALTILLIAGTFSAWSHVVTDMEGHEIALPVPATRIYGASPADQLLLYAIDPNLIVARSAAFKAEGARYTNRALQSKPLMGQFVNGALVNIETLVRLRPDVVLLWDEASRAPGNENFKRTLDAAKIPVLITHHRTYDDIVSGLLLVGRVSGQEQRARELVEYALRSRDRIAEAGAHLQPAERPKVYLSESDDGFVSRCNDSLHVALIRFAGGRIVPECKTGNPYAGAQTNLEALLGYDPDVIFTISPNFATRTITTQEWRQLRAVRAQRVFLIPHTPFNWLARPPSFMQILGAEWAASIFYPQRFKTDMVQETRNFYRLFLRVELSDEEAKRILGRAAGEGSP